MKKILKHLALIAPALLITVMLLGGSRAFANDFLTGTGDAASGGVEIVSEESYAIADGVTEGVVTIKTSSGTSTVHVILVKPDAKAKFKALIPGYYTAGSTAESRKAAAEKWSDSSWSWLGVSDMVAQYQSASDSATVLAAINGDFYGSLGKAPSGSVVLEGNELAHSGASEYEYYFASKENGSLGIFKRISGQRKYVQEGICAPFWILRNGEFSQDGIIDSDWEVNPEKRSGLALKANGEAMMITVEAPGVTLKQFAELMKASGFVNGQNLDGGRSITFLSKRTTESNISRKSTMYYSEDGQYFERPTASALILVADEGPANKLPAVPADTTLKTDKDTYQAGEPINVTAGSNIDGAWVSLLKASDADKAASYFWYYTNGIDGDLSWVNGETYDICGEGVCSNREGVTSSSQLPAGDYKIVVFKGDYEPVVQVPITIEPAEAPDVEYSLELDKAEYQVGEQIKFKATAPAAETWVGLYHRDDVIPKDMSYFWYDLLPADQGQWNVLNVNGGRVTEQDRKNNQVNKIPHEIGTDLPDDDYRAVLFESYSGDGTYVVKASVDFKISSGYHITYMDGDTVLKGIEPSGYKDADVASSGIALGKPEKAGHTFVNWYSNKELTGRPVTTLAKGSTGDKTYYAKFTKNTYTLSFDTDGGSAVAPVTALYQEAIEKPADPVKEGYIFTGWVTEKGGSALFDFGKGLSGDTTVYAGWRDEKSLVVSFESNGGTTVADQGVMPGEKAVRPADPTKDGYLFDGWFTDKELKNLFDFDTPVTENITLYAGWTVKPEDSLTLSEESRGDKTYSGDGTGVASDYVGEKLFEYFYGDTVTVEATAAEPGAWVGIFQNKDFIAKDFSGPVNDCWYYVDDYMSKDDRRVDLRTINGSSLQFGINYWVVLLSKDNKVLKAVPFNYRTFNMDRPEVVSKNIRAELEWTKAVANGEEQRPALTIRQVNENFNGTFEEKLTEGKDYTVVYPSASRNPGSYTIKVKYSSPSAPNEDGSIHYMGNTEFEYSYFLTSSDGEYIITYDLDGGTNHKDNPQIFKTGKEVILKSPSRIGYSFDGWFTGDKQIESIPADAEESFVLTAKWVADEDAPYKIKYVLNGGINSMDNPDTYTGNVDIDIEPASRGKYSFDGWFFDEAFTKPADMIPKGTTGDLTLYAKFTAKGGSSAGTYKITTDVTGGAISANAIVKEGASHTVTYEPNAGYEIKSVAVDGVEVDVAAHASSYTFENVTGAHSIQVTYVKATKADDDVVIAVGTSHTVNGKKYVVTKSATKQTQGTVTFTRAKNIKKVLVPATVKLADGRTYKVTAIAAKAFTGKKIRYITIGKNVKQIKANAFKSSKAKAIYIKTKLLKKAKVKGSLRGSKIKTIYVRVGTKKVNKTYAKKYRTYFKKANSGRKVTVK